MQNWLSRWINKQGVAKVTDYSVGESLANLIYFLKNQVTDETKASALLDATKSYKKLKEKAQLEQLPYIYLSYEQYLTEIDTQKIYTLERLRKRVREQFPGLLTIPSFSLVFEKSDLQQVLLCRLFLKKLLESSIETLGDAQDGLFKKILNWVEEIPNIPTANYSFLSITSSPRTTAQWLAATDEAANIVISKLEHQFGETWTRHIVERTYNNIAHRFSVLNTFPVVIALIPDKFLDADKIGRLSKHQLTNVLLEKTTYLEELNETLKQKNKELQKAQNEILLGRKQMENTLEQLTSVLNTVNEGIISANADSKIIMVNRTVEKIFGYTEKELIGQPLSILMPNKYQEAHRRGMSRYMETRTPRVLNTTVKIEGQRKDGSIFPLELNIAETKLDDQIFFTAAVRDITERVAMEEELIQSRDKLEIKVQERTKDLQQTQQNLKDTITELERSNKELEQFAYVASHDLQEPLRMVGSYTQLIKRKIGKQTDETVNEYFYFVIDGVARMRNLISDLLHYSRVGKAKSNFQTVSLNDIIILTQKNLRSSIMSNQAILKVDELPTLFIDKTLISQLFQNLIGNALKFRKEDIAPVITISAKEYKNHWEFMIADNGEGIEADQLDRIFDAFHRANKSGIKGSGIGLAVCKKIVELHKGTIWVVSQYGAGSTFHFTLPKS